MHPREYLDVAHECIQRDEPRWSRTAINRAYYAVYSSAEASLATFGCDVPKTGAGHREVRQLCFYSGVPELQRVADVLREVYSWRVRADYRHDDLDPEQVRLAAQAVSKGRRALKLLDEVSAEGRHRNVRGLIASILLAPVIALHRDMLLQEES